MVSADEGYSVGVSIDRIQWSVSVLVRTDVWAGVPESPRYRNGGRGIEEDGLCLQTHQ